MKNKRTYYHLVLDRSGSMSSCIEQTICGVNQQIRRIKEISERFPDQELVTSLSLFNHNVLQVWTRVSANKLSELLYSDYRPDGTTALLDALGITINSLKQSVGDEIEADEATVVVVVITDGYENASREFTHDQVASTIRELESTGKWTFSYMGATLDAVSIAENLNIKKGNAMYFSINDCDIMYNKVNTSILNYIRSKDSGKIKSDFLDEDY